MPASCARARRGCVAEGYARNDAHSRAVVSLNSLSSGRVQSPGARNRVREHPVLQSFAPSAVVCRQARGKPATSGACTEIPTTLVTACCSGAASSWLRSTRRATCVASARGSTIRACASYRCSHSRCARVRTRRCAHCWTPLIRHGSECRGRARSVKRRSRGSPHALCSSLGLSVTTRRASRTGLHGLSGADCPHPWRPHSGEQPRSNVPGGAQRQRTLERHRQRRAEVQGWPDHVWKVQGARVARAPRGHLFGQHADKGLQVRRTRVLAGPA